MATLNSKHFGGCPIKLDSQMKKLGRSHIEEFIDTTKSIVVIAWFNNKRVLTISHYIGERPAVSILNLIKTTKKNPSKAASSVSIYNKFMGGVYRSHKWYHRIAFHLFNLATTEHG